MDAGTTRAILILTVTLWARFYSRIYNILVYNIVYVPVDHESLPRCALYLTLHHCRGSLVATQGVQAPHHRSAGP